MTYCGTGHRPPKLGGYSESTFDKLVSFAGTILSEHQTPLTGLRPPITTLISGMALGWDMALAVAALELDIPVIAAIPFIGQEESWPEQSQALYHTILVLVDERQIISPGGYAPWKMHKRNQWMVDHSAGVIALWDGSEGGTAGCVSYAGSKMVPVENYWERWVVFQ